MLSTADSVAFWVRHNGCEKKPTLTALPDTAPDDGTTVRRAAHTGGRAGAAVVLYTINGGGHTWPGGSQYLPKRIIGPGLPGDLDANAVIWQFFLTHPRE